MATRMASPLPVHWEWAWAEELAASVAAWLVATWADPWAAWACSIRRAVTQRIPSHQVSVLKYELDMALPRVRYNLKEKKKNKSYKVEKHKK